MSKKILVGFIMDGTAGGVDKYLLHFLEAVWGNEIQIDFLTNDISDNLKSELGKYNSKLFQIARLWQPLKQYRQVKRIIKEGCYEMVYFNISTSMDCVAALAAKRCNVPRRLLHSHSGGNDCESAFKRKVFNILQIICRLFLYKTATEFYACSRKAGYWMYPRKIVDSDRFHVIYNAVNQERFRYLPEVREEVRSDLGIDDRFVVGHAGNFCYQKNHEFLIDVFDALQKKEPGAVLISAGKGPKFDMIKGMVKERGLKDKVLFMGFRKDVDKLFQGMDVFLLPSNFEGLPTVGIEAQCEQLPCVFSDSITDEVRISNSCRFLSLQQPAEVWADEILKFKGYKREDVVLNSEIVYYSLEAQKEQLKRIVNGGADE